MKKILCIILSAIIVFTAGQSGFAAPDSQSHLLDIAKEFEYVLTQASDDPSSQEDKVYLIDINGDGRSEMFLLDFNNNEFSFVVYAYNDYTVDSMVIAKALYTYSGNFRDERLVYFTTDRDTVVLKSDIDYTSFSANGDPEAPAVVYTEIGINSDGYLTEFDSETYYLRSGYSTDFYGNKFDVQATAHSELQRAKNKYETSPEKLLYDFSPGKTPAVSADAITKEQAIEYFYKLAGDSSGYINTDYSGYEEVTDIVPDSEKLKIQNLIHAFEVKEEPTSVISMTEQEILDIFRYTLTRSDEIQEADSAAGPMGFLKFYNSADAQALIYKYTGKNINIQTHSCDDVYCMADYKAELDFIHPDDAKRLSKNLSDRTYILASASEGGEYQVPVIKNIYSLTDSTYLVVYNCSVFGGMVNPYNKDILYTHLAKDEYPETQLMSQFDTYAIVGIRNESADTGYFMIEQGGSGLIDASALKKLEITTREPSNINVDYTKVQGYTDISQYTQYLHSLLSQANPNDDAKNCIIKYICYVIETLSDCIVEADGNRIIITADALSPCSDNASKVYDELMSAVNEWDIELNKKAEICLKIDCIGANISRGVIIDLDASLAELADRADSIKIIIDEEKHGIVFSMQDMLKMLESGICSIKLSRDKNKYTLGFVDKKGKTLERNVCKITVCVPSDNPYKVVYYETNGEKKLWGGQYNGADSTLEFMTANSGIYKIEQNNVAISDISDLTEQEQEAIRFMVSRGCFDVDNGLFNPYNLLTRNEFTYALVSMFYDLDYSAECPFDDVSKSDKYYSHIASSHQNNIVKGFDDNTFRGMRNATKEQVISIASRTIHGQKGYKYPASTGGYIFFADVDDITNWDGQPGELALAVREGLIDKGGFLSPKADITRLEAAVILYRLFNILYDVSPAPVKTQSTSARNSGFPVVPALVGVSVLALGGGAVFFIIRKRRHSKAAYEKMSEPKP